MTPRLKPSFALAGFLVVAPLCMQADAFDDAVIALMQQKHIPGMSLAVVQDGEIVRARGYGLIDGDGSAPVTADTLFQAGSVSKPVTALGAMRLVEAGKLDLDTDVNAALRSWHVPENEFTATEKVTLRRLLSHTAGMTVHGFPGYAVDAPVPTLVQVLDGEKPANTPPIRVDVVPGSIWRYAGGGYTVVQQLMLDVSGQSFPDLMRTTVLEPLGMRASTFAQPLPATLAARTATGHTPDGSAIPGRWHVYPEMAAAGLWTTPSDLARFIIGIQAALAGRPEAVIASATAESMVTSVKDNYGLGFSLAGSGTSRRFFHGGRDEGFDTQLMAYRDTGQGAVIMINANDNSSFMDQVLGAIVKAYGWPDFEPYHPLTPIEDKEPAVTDQVKTIFEHAQAGTFEPDLYTPELGAILAREIPNGGAARQLRTFGAFQSIQLVGRSNEQGFRTYRYHLVFEHAGIVVTCSYNTDGKIAGLRFQPE